MDVLVVLGTSAAYFYSTYSILFSVLAGHEDQSGRFFETSVLLVFFILLGKYLEAIAKGRKC